MRLLVLLVLCLVVWFGDVGAAIAGARVDWLVGSGVRPQFEKAMGPRKWSFPRDFGAHEGFQTEWWYYTGNLETAEGRPFGFQLTFFRQAVDKAREGSGSQWRNNQIYSAHFTVSDIQNQKFYEFERFSRSGAGLAGVSSEPYGVWLEDWSVDSIDKDSVKLIAKDDDLGIDLDVATLMQPVLQGDRGFSVKGSGSGNASHYYSLVQQPTSGVVKIKGVDYSVKGLTWKDHEFSTSSLSAGTVGWDWFSIQLNDGSALMLYLLRREDGSLEATSAGKYVAANGETVTLTASDWEVVVRDRWKSPKSGAVYPVKWDLRVPKLGLDLTAAAWMPNQELNTATAVYWEGAVKYAGTNNNAPVSGNGYTELTGYATRLDRVLGDG